MSGIRDGIVRAALVVSLLVPIYFAVAALGTRFGVFDWQVGFGLLTFRWGSLVMMGAAGLGLLALLVALLTPPRGRGAVSALLALLIPALGLGYGLYVRAQAQDIPPIHDISTDLLDPPAFSSAVEAERALVPGVNGLDLLSKQTGDGESFAALQRAAYPDIDPVTTSVAPSAAWDIALAVAREQGWSIGLTDSNAGVIEASVRSFWYGFTDDIVIRVRAEGTGARVDMRSVSRVGRSDLGANAARMRPYLAEVRARLEAAEQGGPPG